MIKVGITSVFLAAIGSLLVCVSCACAEDIPVLKLGSRVRVSYVDPTSRTDHPSVITGNLSSLDQASLIVKTSIGKPDVVLPRENISELEVSIRRGSRGESTVKGLGYGAAAGIAIGLLSGDDRPGMFSMTAETKAQVFAILLAPVGALMGLMSSSGEQWHPMPTDQIKLGLVSPVHGESRLAVTVLF